MYHKILICTDGSPGAEVATEYAIWLTQRLQAKLTALHISDVRLLEGPLLSDLAGAFGAQPYSALLPQLQEIQKEKANAVLGAIAARCRERGVDCTPTQATGGLVHVLVEQEKTADLVVLGQRGEHAEWAWETLGSSVERMVRASVKPCLVCPAAFREITHLLVAYDGSEESTRATAAGVALAAALHARLTLVTAYEKAEHREQAGQLLEQARVQAGQPTGTIAAQLVHGPAEKAILDTCREVNADLVVMGAYGHTRIRELIIGSTTTQVMRQTTVPVLLSRG